MQHICQHPGCPTYPQSHGSSAEPQAWTCREGHLNNPELADSALLDALAGPCRIYALVPSLPLSDQPPLEYDLGLAPLHKNVETVWQGDQVLIRYYAEPSYSTPVCQRDFEIAYPADNPPRVEVIETISWYRQDGSLHPTIKTLRRTYDGQRWLNWLAAKRQQIVEWLRYHVAEAMIGNVMVTGSIRGSDGPIADLAGVMAEGGKFFATFAPSISAYIGGYAQTFPQAVASTTDWPWLDLPWPGENEMTIRGKFAEQLIYT